MLNFFDTTWGGADCSPSVWERGHAFAYFATSSLKAKNSSLNSLSLHYSSLFLCLSAAFSSWASSYDWICWPSISANIFFNLLKILSSIDSDYGIPFSVRYFGLLSRRTRFISSKHLQQKSKASLISTLLRLILAASRLLNSVSIWLSNHSSFASLTADVVCSPGFIEWLPPLSDGFPNLRFKGLICSFRIPRRSAPGCTLFRLVWFRRFNDFEGLGIRSYSSAITKEEWSESKLYLACCSIMWKS